MKYSKFESGKKHPLNKLIQQKNHEKIKDALYYRRFDNEANNEPSSLLLAIENKQWDILETLLEYRKTYDKLLLSGDDVEQELDLCQKNIEREFENQVLPIILNNRIDYDKDEPFSTEQMIEAYKENVHNLPISNTIMLCLFQTFLDKLKEFQTIPAKSSNTINNILNSYFIPELIKEWGEQRALGFILKNQPHHMNLHRPFLKNGIKAEYWYNHGDFTNLSLALRVGNINAVKDLIKAGANPFYSLSGGRNVFESDPIIDKITSEFLYAYDEKGDLDYTKIEKNKKKHYDKIYRKINIHEYFRTIISKQNEPLQTELLKKYEKFTHEIIQRIDHVKEQFDDEIVQKIQETIYKIELQKKIKIVSNLPKQRF